MKLILIYRGKTEAGGPGRDALDLFGTLGTKIKRARFFIAPLVHCCADLIKRRGNMSLSFRKAMPLMMVAGALSLGACASSGSVDNLESDVAAMRNEMAQVKQESAMAAKQSREAAAAAEAAAAEARSAAQAANAAAERSDRMFQRSLRK